MEVFVKHCGIRMSRHDELPRFTRSLRVNTTLEPRRIIKNSLKRDTVKLQLKRSSNRGYGDLISSLQSFINLTLLQEPNVEGFENVFEK